MTYYRFIILEQLRIEIENNCCHLILWVDLPVVFDVS